MGSIHSCWFYVRNEQKDNKQLALSLSLSHEIDFHALDDESRAIHDRESVSTKLAQAGSQR
eukprot:CAMPEP_0169279052 /NCGR_PEP_ID=MMETSP1016-20121227/54721_1 /TAXON_ID=342587 /ORGANISM="Karlodinium micrum, Strain CCMP2283" /LENGTH=60 /DNA_ID=CAMNT_0009366991 /DNA_START=66 /DNA_END=248 /DNA_ORIENTATION=+